jgi:hypothetical protein
MTSEIPDISNKISGKDEAPNRQTEQLFDMVESHISHARSLAKECESLRTELTLRHKQLAEVRALLRLPKTIKHEAVIRALWLIGEYDRRIDRGAVPERYSTAYWVGKKVSSPYDPIIPEDVPGTAEEKT